MCTVCGLTKYFILVPVPGGQLHRYCLVQFSFKSGQEHPIPKMPHGNSKKNKMPYLCTWESTRDQQKFVAREMKAKEAIHHAITEGLGGLQSCVGLGQVLQNRQQVKAMARHKAVSKGSYPKNMPGAGRLSDLWLMLLNESIIIIFLFHHFIKLRARARSIEGTQRLYLFVTSELEQSLSAL